MIKSTKGKCPLATDAPKGLIKMATLTTAELAAELGTTPRTLRKFLRSDARSRNAGDTLPGKGSRYAIERKAVKGLNARFIKWQAAEAQARAERAAEAAAKAKAAADAPDAPEAPEGD